MRIQSLEDRRIKRKIDILFENVPTEWEQKTTAELGNADQVVKTNTPGMVYARLRNGDTIEVYNDVAPEDHGVKVWIGRRKETPTVWQVIALRDTHSVPQAPRLSYHADQHRFRGPDELIIERKQINQLTIIVFNGTAFIVRVYGGEIPTASGVAIVETQYVDLSSYVPASGAVYVGIEADSNGTLSVHVGAPFASPLMATASLVPLPGTGKSRLGYILLWAEMELLTDDEIVVPFQIPFDRNVIQQNFETIVLDIQSVQEQAYRSQPGLDIYNNQNFI